MELQEKNGQVGFRSFLWKVLRFFYIFSILFASYSVKQLIIVNYHR